MHKMILSKSKAGVEKKLEVLSEKYKIVKVKDIPDCSLHILSVFYK